MPEKKLTNRKVETAGKGLLGDGGGLFLRKESKESGRWFYRYSWGDKRPEMGLGGWPDTTLAMARQRRDEWKLVRQAGKNPLNVKKANKAEAKAKQDNTLENWFERTHEALKGDLRDGGKAGRWDSPLRIHVLPKLGKMPIAEITQHDVEKVLKLIWKTKSVTARKAANRLRIIFDQAGAGGLDVSRDTVNRAMVLLGSQGHKQTSIAALGWKDIPEFYGALGEGVTHLALRLLILTGSRSKPVRFAHLDQFQGNVWTIPAETMKGREGKTEAFRIPLSDEAQKVIEAAKLLERDGYLFPSVRKGVLSDTAMSQHMKRAGLDARPHGFRSALRDWMAEQTQTPYDVAKMMLAQKVGNSVDASYMRSDLIDKRRILLDCWASMVTGEQSKVVQIHG